MTTGFNFLNFFFQVLDGGAVIIRGQPRNGPPPERTLALSEIDAPRLARRPNLNGPGSADDPWSWEAREFLRKLLVGKSVMCTVHHRVPSGREYGHLLINNTDPEKADNVAVMMVAEGLVKVRDNCSDSAFIEAQETAKAGSKGIWSPDSSNAAHVRNITWDLEHPRQLVDRMAGQQIDAVIENVRDGSTVRAFLLPDFYHITLMMSGMRVMIATCTHLSSLKFFILLILFC